MFKGMRHTLQCTKCHETTKAFKEYTEAEGVMNKQKSECCSAPYEYVGLQPYYESILITPFDEPKNELKASEPDEEITSTTTVIVQEKMVEQPAPVKMEVTVEVKQPVTESVSIEDIISIGPKGVSNAQMIPALKAAITENSSIKVAMLKQHYPDVFEGSKKYLPGKMLKQLETM